MLISDEKKQEFEVRGTIGSTLVRSTTLGLALVLAQYSFTPPLSDDISLRSRRTEGTVSQPLSLQLNEVDLFWQINKIYDHLLKSQIDLDADSRRVLYKNLWDLYT